MSRLNNQWVTHVKFTEYRRDNKLSYGINHDTKEGAVRKELKFKGVCKIRKI